VSDWDLLLLWPLVGWLCGSFVWTDIFLTSDLPGMLLFCGVSGPLVLLVRPLCRLLDRSLMADQHPACGKASKNIPPTRTTAG
jgi:hypothetical protein